MTPGREPVAPSSREAPVGRPRVAVVGASDRSGSLGRLPVEFLQRYGYGGRDLPVRPDGRPCPACRRTHACRGPRDRRAGRPRPGHGRRAARARRDRRLRRGRRTGRRHLLYRLRRDRVRRAPRCRKRSSGRARAGGVRLRRTQLHRHGGLRDRPGDVVLPAVLGRADRLVAGPIGFVSQSGALGYGAVSPRLRARSRPRLGRQHRQRGRRQHRRGDDGDWPAEPGCRGPARLRRVARRHRGSARRRRPRGQAGRRCSRPAAPTRAPAPRPRTPARWRPATGSSTRRCASSALCGSTTSTSCSTSATS